MAKTLTSTSPKLKSKSKAQCGGSIVKDIADLAVPFGLLIAMKGIKTLVGKKPNDKKTKKASIASKPRPRSKKTSQKGGEVTKCVLCETSNTQHGAGGASVLNTGYISSSVSQNKSNSRVKSEIAKLTSEIKSLLSHYKS